MKTTLSKYDIRLLDLNEFKEQMKPDNSFPVKVKLLNDESPTDDPNELDTKLYLRKMHLSQLKKGDLIRFTPSDYIRNKDLYLESAKQLKGGNLLVDESPVKSDELMKELSNTDIDELLNDLEDYKGAFLIDQLPDKYTKGCYVINLGTIENGGTHWVALYYAAGMSAFFDSFGQVPPEILGKHRQMKNLLYSSTQLQDASSNTCGRYVVDFCKAMTQTKGKDVESKYNEFIIKFDPVDTVKNDDEIVEEVKLDE